MPTSYSSRPTSLGYVAKARLALRIWRSYARVKRGLRRRPLPQLVEALVGTADESAPLRPRHLGLAVDRALHLGPIRPRCLTSSLVLYNLLREQGDEAVLVIGLPGEARDHAAHAWVELDGLDVGPPPGKGRHVELARYSASSTRDASDGLAVKAP